MECVTFVVLHELTLLPPGDPEFTQQANERETRVNRAIWKFITKQQQTFFSLVFTAEMKKKLPKCQAKKEKPIKFKAKLVQIQPKISQISCKTSQISGENGPISNNNQ